MLKKPLFETGYPPVDNSLAEILDIIESSSVPEDFSHAIDTLEWLKKLSDSPLQAEQIISAIGHDIERAIPERKVRREDFDNYDEFKLAHAKNSALIVAEILERNQIPSSIISKAIVLIERHEFGGDPLSDLLKDADSLSFFTNNLKYYSQRFERAEVLRRCIWGYRRLSERAKQFFTTIQLNEPGLQEFLELASSQNDSSSIPFNAKR